MENVQQPAAGQAVAPEGAAVIPADDRFTEAKEAMGTMVRWEEEAAAGAENTIYLGPVIQGIYKQMKTGVGQNDSTIYEVLLADGQLVSFWGSNLLDGKFAQIEPGREVRVTFLGVAQPKTPSGRPYRNFKVEHAEPVTTMNEVVPGAEATPAAPAVEAAPAAPTVEDAPATAPAVEAAPAAPAAEAPAAPAGTDAGY